MRYPLVIFDFDGTLADSFPFFVAAHNALARRHRFREIADGEAEALRAMSTHALLSRSGLPAWRLPWVARDFTRAMAKAPRTPLFDGVPEVLQALHASGATLALVSSNSPDNIRRILGPELASLFVAIDGGASMFGKHRRLGRLIRRLGFATGDAIYVGDQTADADAARAAGVHFGAVAWGYATPEGLATAMPDWAFMAVPELLQLAEETHTLRPMTGEDAGVVAEMMRALAAEDGGMSHLRATPATLSADGPQGAGCFEGMLALAAGRPVGYVSYTWGYSIWAGASVCQVDDLYIAPEARGRGLGTRLLEAVRAEAVRRGCASLRWTVETGNHGAIALYRRLGASVRAKGTCTWPTAVGSREPC